MRGTATALEDYTETIIEENWITLMTNNDEVKAEEKRVNIPEAREMLNRGVYLKWRPDSSLPEDQQYAVVLYDPEEN